MFKSFEGIITTKIVLPRNLQEYPNPILEKQLLENHMALLRETQSTWEVTPTRIERLKPFIPSLKTMREDQYLKLEDGDLKESK